MRRTKTYSGNTLPQVETDEDFQQVCSVSIDSLPYDTPKAAYVAYALPADPSSVSATFSNTLKFLVKDCDPQTGEPDEEGYDDEYVLEDLELVTADHVLPVSVPNFAGTCVSLIHVCVCSWVRVWVWVGVLSAAHSLRDARVNA